MKATYIFDLDGTLCDLSHRLPILDKSPIDWVKFNKDCTGDKPINPVVTIYKSLVMQGYNILIFTARGEEAIKETRAWLERNEILDGTLYMRKTGDYRPDAEIKKEWFESLVDCDVVGVFEDRVSVVKMWRELGLVCFQVAEGDF